MVGDITYSDQSIAYSTFDTAGSQTFRLVAKPKSISVNGVELKADAYSWESLDVGGVLRIFNDQGKHRTIEF